MLKLFIALFTFLSISFPAVINIPSDYSSIQEGIDASSVSDTVLIADGIYYENLILEKEITLASHAIYDNLDSDWINNEHILNTVISGANTPSDQKRGSCLQVSYGNIQPKIVGITFKEGKGTSMKREDCGITRKERSGGAMMIYMAYPIVTNNRFVDNGDQATNDQSFTPPVINGGAISHFDSDDVEFDEDRTSPNRDIPPSHTVPETMIIQNNYFENNSSGNGENFYSDGYDGSIDVSGSVFEDIDCGSSSVNEFVLHSREDNAAYVQNDISGNCIEENAFYVSSEDGSDANPGTEEEPLLSIRRALSLIKRESATVTTINIAPGIYSKANGEVFPIVIPDNVHLLGSSSENTILDAYASADNQAAVMIIPESENVKVANMTLTGGYSEGHGCSGGGGLLVTADDMTNLDFFDVRQNNTVLENLIVEDNHSHNGGGVSFFRVAGAVVDNVIARNNQATFNGGGFFVYCSEVSMSNIEANGNTVLGYNMGNGNLAYGGGIFLAGAEGTITNATILNNTAIDGGGLATTGSGNTWTMTNSTVSGNNSSSNGGGMFFIDEAQPILSNVTLENNTAGRGGGISVGTATPVFQGCVFTGNSSTSALSGGGAVYIFNEFDWSTFEHKQGSWPVFTDCIMTGNTAVNNGGAVNFANPSAMYGTPDGATLKRVLIAQNESGDYCGGVNVSGGTAEITNCTIVDNVTGHSSQYGSGGVDINWGGVAIITNSIIRNNANFFGWEIVPNYSSVSLNYTNVFNPLEWGIGNINVDPLFADQDNGDYTLSPASPCIDVGIADVDGDGEDDIEYLGLAPDLGVYETLAGPPLAPNNFTLNAFDTHVELSWDPVSDGNFEYYILQRALDENFLPLFSGIVTHDITETNFMDEDVEIGTEYFYRLSYYNGNYGEYTEILSVVAGPLAAPNNFQLTAFESYVELTWDPVSDSNFDHYKLQRATDSYFTPLSNVVTNDLTEANFTDQDLEIGTEYFYRLSYFSGERQSEYTQLLSVTIGELNLVGGNQIPDTYSLKQNYPNPFNPSTKISFDLPSDVSVRLTVFDMMGKPVKYLVNGSTSAGRRSVYWNGRNNDGQPVGAGLYIYTIQTKDFSQTRKMMLLK